MSKNVLMLTQTVCPYCDRAKVVLNGALEGDYNDHIEFINREDQPERFAELRAKYEFLTVPTFIDLTTGDVLSDSQAATIVPFMEEHIAL
ncbi:glutaredoxin family protein [Brochothrix campestris]|uniref:Thioredoxin-related protein n=1 Tax=Brochothrix campestris FSL F6-1037 TaxID=1265861 RepID=W7CTP7_9LIST|nr:thioredoxin [Brochothrix campestris]EUJ36308.1 thioredoxin-related protein [Brochothrix campestris FSL F6-1037]